MNNETYYGCSGGCRNCPRLRQCKAAARTAVPAMAETDSGTVWEPTHEPAGLSEFLSENPEHGILRIQAFRGDQAIPLPNVHITVYKELDGQTHTFFEGDTDESGLIDGIRLPAPARSGSTHPGASDPYATYRLAAEHPQFQPLNTTVDIFQNIKTVQPVQLQLRTE